MVVRRARVCALGVLLLAVVGVCAPSGALADACSLSADDGYTGNCGPRFVVPTWGDGGGWADPSKYATIQLADVNGDGRDELIGRNDQGLEIFWFDTTFGQWRPQVDANGVQQVIKDFRSPLPSEEGNPNWSQAQYALTIRTANLDGAPGNEIYARFADGLHAYTYVPPAGSRSIDGGSWQRVGGTGGFSDAAGGADPSSYATIHSGALGTGAQAGSGLASIFGRRTPTSDNPASLGISALGPGGTWTQSGAINKASGQPPGEWNDVSCGQPACYLDVNAAPIATSVRDPATANFGTLKVAGELLGRPPWGFGAWTVDSSGQYFAIGGNQPYVGPGTTYGEPGPFADVPGPDCPFSSNGASGPGSGDCLGSGPAYYETLRTANIDGKPGDELLARASDGLRVKRFNGTGYDSLATLTDLAVPPLLSVTQPGLWGSIRTGDLDGDGKDEVLALDGTALQVWSYNPATNAWTKWQPSTPLALAADPWLTHPEYYATIQVGDVDGDGHDDVVARGPYGIRTWFYNRRGTGGWERYLPDGFAPFPGNQQAAYAELTKQAKAESPVVSGTVTELRQVWTGEAAPSASDLTSLQVGQDSLAAIANCTGSVPGNPPRYQSCTPPAGTSGQFSAADWLAVVNEMLAEITSAQEVLDFFAQLGDLRTNLFIAQNAELPAIGSVLGVSLSNETPTTPVNMQSLFAGITGIAASIAGAIPGPGTVVSAALWVVSELLSIIPSGSPTASSATPFQTTYAGLQDKFATVVSEATTAVNAESQDIRQDPGLLALVGQLRSRGTWAMDTIGMGSAANQAFAIWAYKALVPTVFDRYQITRCGGPAPIGPRSYAVCQAPPPGPGVLGFPSDFITVGPSTGGDEVNCGQENGQLTCSYQTAPPELMNRVWGTVPAGCTYVPGQAQPVWTFGCPAGVDARSSILDNTWGFASHSGDPWIWQSATRAAAAGRRSGPTIALGRGRIGRRSGARAFADVRGGTLVPPRLRLAGATLRLDRLLFEAGGRGELARPRGRAAAPLTIRRRAGGGFVAQARSRPGVRVLLQRIGRSARVTVTVQVRASLVRTPAACEAWPAAVSLRTPHLELRTRLRLSDGTTRRVVQLRHRWRCARDTRGNVDHLVPERGYHRTLRGGLAVALHGPRRVTPGGTAHYIAVVSNRRTSRRRSRSSLYAVVLDHRRAAPLRVRELRRGRSHSLRFTRSVPRSARSPFCAEVVATAAGARPTTARACAGVRAAAPAFTG
jgi:hypothetical protein